MQHATQKRGRTTTIVEEANLRKGARSIKPAMRAPWQTRSEKANERQAKLRASSPSRSRSIRLDRSKARRASVEGKKKKKKRMVVKPPAPYLLLAVLAVLSGRTKGEMKCDTFHSVYYFYDEAKCWAPEINKEFGVTFTGCSDGFPYADNADECEKTVAKINADGSSYKGPDISCFTGTTLGWNSEENCEEGIKALTAVLSTPTVNADDNIPTETSCASAPCDCSSFPIVSSIPGYCDDYTSGRDQFCDACCLQADCMTPRSPAPPPTTTIATTATDSGGGLDTVEKVVSIVGGAVTLLGALYAVIKWGCRKSIDV